MKLDDDDEDWGTCLGIGSVSTLYGKPSPEELKQIAEREPIGFLRFPEKKQPKQRKKRKCKG